MNTSHLPSCPVRETIDLLPEVIDLINRRLTEIYGENPEIAEHKAVSLEMHKLVVCATANIDAYYHHVLHLYQHIELTHKTTGLSPATVYNHNAEHKKLRKIHPQERFSKI